MVEEQVVNEDRSYGEDRLPLSASRGRANFVYRYSPGPEYVFNSRDDLEILKSLLISFLFFFEKFIEVFSDNLSIFVLMMILISSAKFDDDMELAIQLSLMEAEANKSPASPSSPSVASPSTRPAQPGQGAGNGGRGGPSGGGGALNDDDDEDLRMAIALSLSYVLLEIDLVPFILMLFLSGKQILAPCPQLFRRIHPLRPLQRNQK